MPAPFGQDPPEEPLWVPYLDLAGGRNTKKDPHALDRNQLAASDNTWQAQGNTVGKRPGSISLALLPVGPSVGSIGQGVSLVGMTGSRFFTTTALVVQGANNHLYAAPLALPAVSVGPGQAPGWLDIGMISGGTIQSAKLYDPDPTNPNGPDGTLFIVDGIDTPKLWLGPGNTLRNCQTAQLPTKSDGTGRPITPKFVSSLFSSIFYAGDSADPCMVYISNPFLPQTFNTNLIQTTAKITGSNYIGLPIGRSDDGGVVTGMAPQGSSMIIYKESNIHAAQMVGILGDLQWGEQVVSNTTGLTSSLSLVAFDQFHVFLGNDGVYTFNLNSNPNSTKISSNNPDLFDGPTARIVDRTTAVGVRTGNKYLIFYDDGGASGLPSGHPTAGVWFDFDKLDADGLPTAGTISNMPVAGAFPLRGPHDAGGFAWASATTDVVGQFQAPNVYSDFGQPITTTILGKADFFYDVLGESAPIDFKWVDRVHLLLAFPLIFPTAQAYTFTGSLYLDQLALQLSSAPTLPLPTTGQALVGSAIVGSAVLGPIIGTPAYQELTLWQAANARGKIIQIGFTESSIYPWTCLGYTVLISRSRRVAV